MEALFNDAYYAEGVCDTNHVRWVLLRPGLTTAWLVFSQADDTKPEFPDDPLLDGVGIGEGDGEGEQEGQREGEGEEEGEEEGEAQDAAEESGIRIRVPTVGPDGRKLTRREREKEKKRLKKASKAAKAASTAPALRSATARLL